MAGALVLGGAGFIGTYLLRDLVARRCSPLISGDIAETSNPVSGVDYRYCDVRNPIELDLSGVDTIYNLAGLVATPGHPDAEYFRTNVTGAASVCDFAEVAGARTNVFTSTMSIYPTGEDLKVDSFAFALGQPGREVVYNFAYPDRCTIADICKLISAELGKPEPRRNLPVGVMRRAAHGFELLEPLGLSFGINRARIDKLVESTNIYPQFLIEHGFEFKTSLRDGIHEWLRSIDDDPRRAA